jgi:hypothetical protein
MAVATRVVVVVAVNLSLGASSLQMKPARQGVCDREGEKVVGHKPVHVGGSIKAPKQVRHVAPKYPEFPPGTVGRGMWIGEALIDGTGKVTHVWPIREPELTPPFPAFNAAIVDAIRQWEFEPLIVEGKPMAVCMAATLNINWG